MPDQPPPIPVVSHPSARMQADEHRVWPVTEWRNLIGLLAGASGVVALVTPFFAGVTPLQAIRLGLDGEGVFVFAIAGASHLAIPIAAWQVRRLVVPAPVRAEIVVAYLLSTVAMLPVLIVSVLALSGGEQAADAVRVIALLVYWCSAAGNVSLLVRNRLRDVAPGVVAEVYLLLGYLPNALYALIFFSYGPWFGFGPSWGWDAGAYVVLTTCVLNAAQVVLLLRNATSSVKHAPFDGASRRVDSRRA